MPADDNPLDALQKQFDLEDSSRWPPAQSLVKVANTIPLPPLLRTAVAAVNVRFATDSQHRIKVMLETCADEIKKHEDRIANLEQRLSPEESQRREKETGELMVDGARKASNTRSPERVKRIGLILANSLTDAAPIDADMVEEMMRVAMELTDNDISHLRELVRIEGALVEPKGRIERWTAHQTWEQGSWRSAINGEIDSVFSKLESYGLVSRIPPPNNLNITADFQNRYLLLMKGLRFVKLIGQTPP
jgi:hypothetical protein